MKTLLLILATLLLICIVCTSLNAQSNEGANEPRFGIKGGLNLSNLYTKDADKDKMLVGFNAGLFCKLPIVHYQEIIKLAVQPELYFTAQGAEVTYNNSFVNGTARFKLNYLELPILFVLNITDYFNIHAGPYASILMSGKVTNESSIDLFNFEDNIDVNDYNRFDAGIAAGLGLDIGVFSLGVRYNYGLIKVGKEKSYMGTTYTFPDAHNGVLNIYVSFGITPSTFKKK